MKTLICRFFHRVHSRKIDGARWIVDVRSVENRNHSVIPAGYRLKPVLLLGSILVFVITSFVYAESQKNIKKITLGVRADAPPFSSFDGDDPNQARGYTVDLCRRIVERAVDTGLYCDVEYKEVNAANRFDFLQSGDIDLLCGATTVTLERSRVGDFSLFTFLSGISVMYLEEEPQTNDVDSGPLYVGVLRNTTSETEAKRILENLERTHDNFGLPESRQVKLVTVDNHYEGLRQLKAGTIKAYLADREILLELQQKDIGDKNPTKIVVSEDYYSVEPYAIGVHIGDAELRFIANSVLSELYNWDLHGNQREHIFTVLSRNFPRKRFSKSLESLFRLQRVTKGQPIIEPAEKAECP